MAGTEAYRTFIAELGGNSEQKIAKLAMMSDQECTAIFHQLMELRPYIESSTQYRQLLLGMALKVLDLEQLQEIQSWSDDKCREFVFSAQAMAGSVRVKQILKDFDSGLYEKKGAPQLLRDVQTAVNERDELSLELSSTQRREKIDAAFESNGVYGFLRQHGFSMP